MKLYVKTRNDKMVINVNYNRLAQAMIYNNLNSDKLKKLHDTGYTINGREFKLFTFSQLMGKNKFNSKNMTIEFEEGIELVVTSCDKEFIQNLSENLVLNGMTLGDSRLDVEELKIKDVNVDSNKILIETLSPIVAYSTQIRNGRKFTRYFNPEEEDFIRIVKENLIKKHKIITNSERDVKIEYITGKKKTVTRYKDIIIEAYSGQFLLEGDSSILNTALSCGLGSKSSQGFGCIELRGVPYDRSNI